MVCGYTEAMQPLVLTLPDSIRDRLEVALDLPAEPQSDGLVQGFEKIVGAELLNLHPAPEDREFLRTFRESTLGLQLGSATPAIMMRNLPRHGDTGHHFVLGLSSMLGNGGRGEQSLHTAGAQPVHRDTIYQPDAPHKAISMIYCREAGNPVVPTVMVTADEIIDHWAELRVAKGRYAPDALAQAKEDLIAELRNETLTYRRNDGTDQKVPLLTDNPNYQPGTGAPRTLFCVDYNYPKYFPRGREGALHHEFKTALNSIRNALSPESFASTENNTATFYNDPLIMHARGSAHEALEHKAHEGRLVHAYDMHNSVLLPPGQEYTPQISATGSPISRVDFVERDGSMVLNHRSR